MTGTLSDGNSVTIGGTDFGTHADFGGAASFLNACWNKCESGGMPGGNLDWEEAGGGQDNWQYVASGSRTNRSHHLQKYFNVDRLGGIDHFPADSDVWYSSFWFRLLPNTQSGKTWRLWADSPNNLWTASGGSENRTKIRIASENPQNLAFGGSVLDNVGGWHFVEILVTDTDAGTLKIWCDGSLIHDYAGEPDWFPTPFPQSGHNVVFGMMIDDPAESGGDDGAYCFQDIFFNLTQARVVLTNANTWAASTQREVQIPTSWAATSIDVSFNQGAFGGSDTAYLYVIDSAGSVSAAHEVTIGAAGGEHPPKLTLAWE